MPGIVEFNDTIGHTIPADTPHAVSVSLPTWAANVGYEEGQDWVISRMQTGYPRFFVHKSIDRFAVSIVAKHGSSATEKAMLFPSNAPATRCRDWIVKMAPQLTDKEIRIIDFIPNPATHSNDENKKVLPRLSAVVYPKEHWPLAKQFWQHSGDGVSSRRAEFCEKAFHEATMVEKSTVTEIPRMKKGPRRYQRNLSRDEQHTQNGHYGQELVDSTDPCAFVEERFGRNLNMQFAARAKLAIRRRIAGSLTADTDLHEALQHPEDLDRTRQANGFSVDDVYLHPCGMSAIFNTHRTLMCARPEEGRTRQSISYGFPYVDTLKVLEKFGPGALFYGYGEEADLDDLEKRCESGERFLALFCEFPGNPLLKTPNLIRIRQLSQKYDFAVVVDETIGNFLNVNVLPYADVVVSSLTKIFSGDSNVMGGAAILNPQGQYYHILKRTLELPAQDGGYEDNHFEEDSIFLERNSRDFVDRIKRVNVNAEALCKLLTSCPKIKQVNYPQTAPSRPNYDACRVPNGGYGGLLSCTFHALSDAKLFYDNLETAKGPSLGTNFTLSSPFVLLAHYGELEWAAGFGCPADLCRFSVGLEDTSVLVDIFEKALAAIPERSADGEKTNGQANGNGRVELS